MINDKDAGFYHENGYIVVDDVYSMAEVEAMRAVVEELVEKSRKIADHNDIYDLEPAHSADKPRVRRIKNHSKCIPCIGKWWNTRISYQS